MTDPDDLAHRPRRRSTVLLFLALALASGIAVIAVISSQGGAPGPGPDDQDVEEPSPPPVRVEVLNGSGVAGVARAVTHRLRAEGFDVVFFGNAARFDHPRSLVLDRVGDTLSAHSVATTLGIDSVAIEPDPGLVLEVTVVLGADWSPTPAEPVSPRSRFRRAPAASDREP